MRACRWCGRCGGRANASPDACPDARVAVYYAPLPDDPLFAAGAPGWAATRRATRRLPQPDIPDIAEVTADPRRYGFHATLKPPMRLRPGWQWHDVAAMPRRMLADASRRSICRRSPCRTCSAFLLCARPRRARRCRRWPMPASSDLDAFRGPPSEAELARRRRADLSRRQDAMLMRWGYPYVFDTWFFHMTLTRRLSAAEKHVFMPAAEAYFARAIATPRRVKDICLFVQPVPARRSLSGSVCRCAVERGKEARHTFFKRSIVDDRFHWNAPGIATLRASRAAISAAFSRPRDASRAARTSGEAVTSITRTGKRWRRLEDDCARDVRHQRPYRLRLRRLECRSAAHVPAIGARSRVWQIFLSEWLMRFAARVSGPRDDAAHEAKPAVICHRLLRRIEQSVLPCPAGPDHQNQHRDHTAVVDRVGREVNPPPRRTVVPRSGVRQERARRTISREVEAAGGRPGPGSNHEHRLGPARGNRNLRVGAVGHCGHRGASEG